MPAAVTRRLQYISRRQLIGALHQIADDIDELADARCKSRGLTERLCQLVTDQYTAVFFSDMLQRANANSKTQQRYYQCELNSAIAVVNTMKNVRQIQATLFQNYANTRYYLMRSINIVILFRW